MTMNDEQNTQTTDQDGSQTLTPPSDGGATLAPPAEGGEIAIGGALSEPSTIAPEKPDAHGWWWGTGRRKAAVARVRIKPGNGDFKVQVSRKKTKTVEEYFTEIRDQNDAVAALKVTNTLGKMDVVVRLDGGGYMGQAQALLLGVARALKKFDPSLEGVLREHGFLTRDAREVERKKYGLRGARRAFQFSKR
jgi:small subunit ribosomal protein S9